MSGTTSELSELGAAWLRLLQKGLQADGWGQIVEAVDSYDKLANNIVANIDALNPDSTLRTALNKVVLCINLRSAAIQGASAKSAPNKDQMATLVPFLKGLFGGEEVVFPIDTSRFRASGLITQESKREMVSESKGGSLQSAPSLKTGETFVTFDVEKWGLKDAEDYVDPRVTVCVYDPYGNPMESEQDTPLATSKKGMHVHFGFRVHIQTPVRKMKEANAAVFFEFKHWKPKKKKISTRCFAFLEMDELKEGAIALEQYKKPTDTKRKKLKLHTIKPLYLHLTTTFHSV